MITKELQETLNFAAMEAIKRRHEYVTLEHLLYALLHDRTAAKALRHSASESTITRSGERRSSAGVYARPSCVRNPSASSAATASAAAAFATRLSPWRAI